MRRLFLAGLMALGCGSTLAVPAAVAAPPQPVFTATLSEGPTCEFTAVGTFKNTKVDKVYGIWSQDGTAFENFLFTTEAPGTGPNAGTFKSRTATFHVGPLASTAEAHTIYVLVQFYSNGAHQGEVLRQVDAFCSRPAP